MKKDRIPWINLIAWVTFLSFVMYTFTLRVMYASPFARSWDQVDFALGVTDFDLFTMQPHFPGYPYFILGGMIVHHFWNDPVLSLSIFNSILTLTSIVPMYLLFKRKYATVMTLSFVAVIYSMSYFWVMTTEPMSEAAAVAMVWWYVWSLYQAYIKKTSFGWRLLPLILFSILMGIRLSYLPFGLGIILLWWSQRKHFEATKAYVVFLVKQLLLAIGFQLIWVIGLVLSTGSISTFIELAFGFVFGHFNEWGGAVTADSMPLWERLYILLFHNLIWTALFTESWAIAGLYIGLLILIVIQLISKKAKVDRLALWVFLLSAFYFLWALFAQNIDKPRHILPLSGLLIFASFMNFTGRMKKLTIVLSLSLVFVQSWVGIGLVQEKAEEPPAVYQLSDYLSKINNPFIVYTWEESRVMEYLHADFSHKEIFTYEYFQSKMMYSKNKSVFLTGHVVRGFEMQGHDVQDRVRKIAEFQSNDLFDPVYSDIQLYEWIGD